MNSSNNFDDAAAKTDAMERNLRSSLQMAILQIVIPQDRIHRTKTTTGAIRALTELVYQYTTKSLAPDLHQFSNHANRKSTIAPEDVALVLRKLPQLQEQLQQSMADRHHKTTTTTATATTTTTATTATTTIHKKRSPIANRKKPSKSSTTTDILSSSSSSDDSSISSPIQMPPSVAASNTNNKKKQTSRGSASTKGATAKPAIAHKKKSPPSYAETKAQVDRLLNDDESSSEDDLPDFMKRPATTKKVPQSQIRAILNSYSSDSGLSSPDQKRNSSNSNSSDEEEEEVMAPRPTKRTKQVILSSQEDDSEMEFGTISLE